MLAGAVELREFSAGSVLEIGPFRAGTRLLPHWVPNAGVRLTAGGRTLAYTGDSGPAREVVELARGADVLLAEATYPGQVPPSSRPYLSSARERPQMCLLAMSGRRTVGETGHEIH
jgi:ribonuclease BN (tRNA processing enzyme)